MPLFPLAILGAFALLALALHLRLRHQGYRAGRVPRARRVTYEFDPPNSMTFTGGARIGGFNATVPMAKLTIDHRWARVRLRALGPRPIWIERPEVVGVRRISATLGAGIMFDTADGHLDGIIFWTFDAEPVLRAFEWYDWPVRRALRERGGPTADEPGS